MNNESLAFLFPGQASQYVGMGRDLYNRYPEVKALYEQANGILGYDISRLSFDGPADKLRQTVNTQPAILVHSVAVATILNTYNLMPEYVAGHSLGEYSALVAAGYLDFSEALKLVHLRSSLMQKAGNEQPGTMAVIIGLPSEEVERVCREAATKEDPVQATNYNAPDQIAIAGTIVAVQRACDLAKKAGARRAIQLEVSGAFHSCLMQNVRDELSPAIKKAPFNNSNIPLIANVTAKPVTDKHEIFHLMIEQITSPVRWTESMGELVNVGIKTFIEVGPGSVLKGLMRRIHKPSNVLCADTVESIEETIEIIQKKVVDTQPLV